MRRALLCATLLALGVLAGGCTRVGAPSRPLPPSPTGGDAVGPVAGDADPADGVDPTAGGVHPGGAEVPTSVAERPVEDAAEPVDAGAAEGPGGADVAAGIDGSAFRPVRRFDEVRALWVVRSTMTSAAEIRAMVEEAQSGGFNTLVVQIRGRADAFYTSSLEPRGEAITDPEGFDPLALVISEAHARELAVHAWVNTHLVWGPAALPTSTRHLVRARPDWLAVPRQLARSLYDVDPANPRFVAALRDFARENARTVEGLYSSPSHPEVQDRVHAIWMELVERYDLDGIHFDYIRFPSSSFDYSRGALDRFDRWVSSRLPLSRLQAVRSTDPLALVDALPEEWAEFRRDQITSLVARIYHDVKAVRPDLVVSAAVIADADDAYSARFQDWRGWLESGILDVAVPMAYTSDDARFTRLIREARMAAGNPARVWAGIGAYLNTVEGTLSKIDLARREDAGGIVLFSYDWAVTEGRVGEAEEPFLARVGRERFTRR